MQIEGRIVKGIAGFYYVYADENGLYECKAKGVFRNRGQKPIVGDNVIFEVVDSDEKKGNISKIMPRKNLISRPEVANVDQALVVVAARDPSPSLIQLDRFLVAMERLKVKTVICLNKTDLEQPERISYFHEIYEKAGYQVIDTCATNKKGTEGLHALLRGKTTVLSGLSGVGKSSLLNAVFGKEKMETGTISQKTGRGRHTTRHSEIFCFEKDTYLIDTPGFSSLYTPDMKESELAPCFPEFLEYIGKCRYLGCAHIDEPDCAVKQAIGGHILESRYKSYRFMYLELKEKNRRYD